MKILRKIQQWLNRKYPVVPYRMLCETRAYFRESGSDPWTLDKNIQGISYCRTLNPSAKKGQPREGIAGSIIFTVFSNPPELYKMLSEGIKVDVRVVTADDKGEGITFTVHDAELLNEGSGFSIDDMSHEIQVTYKAKKVTYCASIAPVAPATIFFQC